MINFTVNRLAKLSICALVVTFLFSACDELSRFKLGSSPKKEENAAQTEERERGLESAEKIEILTPKERTLIYRLFLTEMHEQIFARKLKDVNVYNSWMNVLEQGASIEGVYRGLILSQEYSELEKGIVSPEALGFFSKEMVYLMGEKNNKNVTEQRTISEISKQASQLSLFTLKRLLGEKILSAIDEKKNDRESLANFYSDLLQRWGSVTIDYGLKMRNNKDRDYHLQWSLHSSRGRIQWELLNRMHRIMNYYGKVVYIH